MATELPYSKAWRNWIASHAGQGCLDLKGLVDKIHLKNRLGMAFAAGWNLKPNPEVYRPASPYESTVVAVDTDEGYKALHENIQDGWEPVFHWKDDHGNHIVMRRKT